MSVVLAILVAIAVASSCASGEIRLMTWNVRGYPEDTAAERALFSSVLSTYAPDVLCIQEIANADRVNTFKSMEMGYGSVAFTDSSDGMDNAVFARNGTLLADLLDPPGFQHPAQLAYFNAYGGSAALAGYVLNVHLSYEDNARRAQERATLVSWAKPRIDAGDNVIIAGDFNTKGGSGDTIYSLAQALRMTVVEPALGSSGTTCAGSAYDWILVSPSLTTAWCITVQVIVPTNTTLACDVSDHRPVLATFKPKTGGTCPGEPPLPPPGNCTAFVLSNVDAVSECITLRNASTATADLQGWKLSDGEGSYTFPASIVVQPGGAYQVCMPTYNPTRYTQGLYLNNSHDQVYLYAPVECGGGLVDSRAW
jgi:endonuclease/exonuclease/phosphatase family metal-dependent hydrolase